MLSVDFDKKKQLHNSMLSIYSDKNVYPRLFLKCFMRFDLKVRIISHKKMSSQDVHSMSSPTEMPGYALYLEFIHARYLSLATSWCWCYCCCVPNPIGRWVCEQQTVYCHKSENNCCLVSFFFVLFSRASGSKSVDFMCHSDQMFYIWMIEQWTKS